MAKLFESLALTLSLASLIQAHASPEPAAFDLLPRQDTSSTPRPALGSVKYGTTIYTCTVPGTVALTFDDGPGPYTAQLLDTLAATGAKATFFVLGNQTQAGNSALITRMYQEGHQIASHTYDHISLDSLSSIQRSSQMTRTETILKDILGFFPTYMRPPYGFCTGQCVTDMGKLGYHVINWSVDPKDFANDSPTLIQNSKNIWDGAFNAGNVKTSAFIPLTHDTHYQTVYNLAPYMITGIKAKGYKMVTVGECLGDPASNWYRDVTTGGVIQNKVVNQPQAVSMAPSSSANSTSASASTSVSTSARATSSSASAVSASTTSSAVRSTLSAALSSATSSSSTSSTSPQATRANAATQLAAGFVMYAMLAMLFMAINA